MRVQNTVVRGRHWSIWSLSFAKISGLDHQVEMLYFLNFKQDDFENLFSSNSKTSFAMNMPHITMK